MADRGSGVLEPLRHARAGDPAIDLEPVLFVVRRERAHRLAHGVAEIGLPLEGGVDVEEAIVDRPIRRIEDHLDDAEALIDRVEQLAVLRRAVFRARRSCRPCIGVDRGAEEAGDPAVIVAQRRTAPAVRPSVAVRAGGEGDGPVHEIPRFAGHDRPQDVAVLAPAFRPDAAVGLAKGLRMPFPNEQTQRIIVQGRVPGAPGHISRQARIEHEVNGVAQGGRPGVEGSERRISPVVGADQCRHLSLLEGPSNSWAIIRMGHGRAPPSS